MAAHWIACRRTVTRNSPVFVPWVDLEDDLLHLLHCTIWANGLSASVTERFPCRCCRGLAPNMRQWLRRVRTAGSWSAHQIGKLERGSRERHSSLNAAWRARKEAEDAPKGTSHSDELHIYRHFYHSDGFESPVAGKILNLSCVGEGEIGGFARWL